MTRHIAGGIASVIFGAALLTGCQEAPPEANATKVAAEKSSSDYDYHMRAGNAANDIENYPKAEDEFRKAEDAAGSGSPRALLPKMSRALQISNQGRFDEADTIFKSVSKSVSDQHDLMLTARYELYLGTHEANRRNYDKASDFAGLAEKDYAEPLKYSLLLKDSYNEEKALDSTLGDSVMIPEVHAAVSGLATTLELKERIAYEKQDYASAGRDHKILLTLLENSRFNPPGILARSTRLDGIIEAQKGDLHEAEFRLDNATDRFEKYQPKERPLASTLFMAAIPRVGDDLEKALERLRHGKEIATTSHISLPENLAADYLSILQQTIKKHPEQAQALSAESFDALQLVGGNVTAQVASKALARLSFDDPNMRTLLKDMEDADLELRRLYFQKDALPLDSKGEASPEQIAAIDAQIAATKQKHDAAEAKAENDLPEYKKLTSVNPSATAVQDVLSPDAKEALIEFFVGEHEGFAVLVEKQHVRSYRIDLNAAAAAKAVAALREAFLQRVENGSVVEPVFDVAAAHALYATLFAPVDDEIRKLNRLIVVSNGALSSLPLEVLVTDETKPVTDKNYKAVPFLITKVAISYAPSPQTLVVQRTNTKPAAGSRAYIGFGDFQSWTPRQLAASFSPDRCREDFQELSELPSLPGTRREISAVASKVFNAPPDDMVLGAAFTKARLTTTDLTQYQVIHLATHAFLPTDLHCLAEPLIIMSTARGAPNVDDSLLKLGDILALKLDANIVMLSACNTAGPSGATTGDSLSGLASAFFFAGARGLLVTHWSLDDDIAPLLVALALRPIGPARDSAADLQGAQVSLIQQRDQLPARYSHPYYWAPFVLVGDGVRPSAPAS